MFIINLLKSWIKKNQYFKKSGPQSSLSGFLEKSKSRNFPKVSSFAPFLVALFFFVGNFKVAHAAWWSDSKSSEEEKNYPGKPPTDFVKKFSDYLDDHTDENKTIPKISDDLKKQLHEEEGKKPHASEVDSNLIRERVAETIRKGLFSIEEKKDPYIKDFAVFRAISKQSFETNLRLVSTAQEPLFLDNKEAFSFEIRPFVSHMMTEDHLLQLGSIFTVRKNWGNKYVSMQGLYGFDAEMFDMVSHDALLDVTYGQFFNDFLAGSLTLSSGFTYSDVTRRVESRSYDSHPKSFSLGLSPLLVYYLPTKIPLDLFLGGDVYYSYRFAFEELSRGEKCIYDAENNLLYRVKAGPSYTMKRRGKTRLYQLRFLAAFNVQSQIPDRFTLTPNVLFESQGHEVRGGYLFNLGFDLGMLKKSWSLSYGLRF